VKFAEIAVVLQLDVSRWFLGTERSSTETICSCF